MDQDPRDLTRDEIIAYAAARGNRVTRDQLIRWHRAGLIPRPRQRSKGRGKGTVSTYPAVVAPLTVFLVNARRRRRSLDDMAWLAWFAGFPVTARIRALLESRYSTGLDRADQALAAFERGDPDNPIDVAEQLTSGGFERIERQFRPTAARIAFETIAGHFNASVYSSNDLAVFAKRYWKSADDQPLEGDTAWIAEAIFGVRNHRTALDAVRRLSDAQLEADRDAALELWKLAFSGVASPLYFGVFELVFMIRRVSGPVRLAIAYTRRQARRRGYATLAAFYEHLATAQANQP